MTTHLGVLILFACFQPAFPGWLSEARLQLVRGDQTVVGLDPRCGGPCASVDQGGPNVTISGLAVVGRQLNTPQRRANVGLRVVMLMAPAVHPTGPSGSFSVAGSMSFENLYMVNGVSVNENLRGQAQDLVIDPGELLLRHRMRHRLHRSRRVGEEHELAARTESPEALLDEQWLEGAAKLVNRLLRDDEIRLDTLARLAEDLAHEVART